MKMNNKIMRFVCFFAIVSLVFVLNIYGLSQNNIATEYYNPSLSLSASYNPNILLLSLNSDISADIETTGGITVRAYERGEIPESEYDYWIDYMFEEFPQIPESDKLDDPNYSYNCHSYAWYNRSEDNTYWINLPNDFIDDPHCSDELTFSQLQPGDIVTYWTDGYYYDNDGNLQNGYHCAHSAVVESISGNKIVCVSKWGPAGLYRHDKDCVPPEYKNNGDIDTKYYRYYQGIHFWGWNKVSETQHEWKCNRCTATNNARAPHNFYISESYNSTSHRIQCYDCGYGYYEDHDLYLHTAEPGDYVVKCRDCSYTIECSEDPEFIDGDETGHWVDCTCGCYSFFEEHSYNYHWLPPSNSNRLFYHRAVCSVCTGTHNLPHNWVSIGGGVVCSDCGLENEFGGVENIMSLSDEELSLLLSSMCAEELEQFIASLPEDAVARVTAILPPDDEHLTE